MFTIISFEPDGMDPTTVKIAHFEGTLEEAKEFTETEMGFFDEYDYDWIEEPSGSEWCLWPPINDKDYGAPWARVFQNLAPREVQSFEV